jgi:hypothetical protein
VGMTAICRLERGDWRFFSTLAKHCSGNHNSLNRAGYNGAIKHRFKQVSST